MNAQPLTADDADLFDAALDGPDEGLALDTCLAWFEAYGPNADDRALRALVDRLRGDHD